MSNESEGSNSNASSLVTTVTNNPIRAESVSPLPVQTSNANSVVAQSLHLKLQNAVSENAHQYPPFVSAVAAALHNQIGHQHQQQQQQPLNNSHHNHNNYVNNRNTATPGMQDNVDNQSEAGSERSVHSPFVTTATTSVNTQNHSQSPHPAHSNHQTLPYHMHHSLIQHLTDMRDLYGGHQSLGAINHHSNH